MILHYFIVYNFIAHNNDFNLNLNDKCRLYYQDYYFFDSIFIIHSIKNHKYYIKCTLDYYF